MERTRIAGRSLLSTATVLAATLALATVSAAPGAADTGTGSDRPSRDDKPPETGGWSPVPTTGPALLAKATPDECYVGTGPPEPPGSACAFGQPKVNQSYVWGLSRSGKNLWFGTAANVHCLTAGVNLGNTDPIENDDYVCEYGESQQRMETLGLPPVGGDWRPPKVYLYDTQSRKLTDKTGAISKKSKIDKQRLESTVGIRAAGSHQGVVLLGGPGPLGLNLFAFDGTSGRYLGSKTLTRYGNIRHFVTAEGVLYAGVGVGINGSAGGAVLRWTGNKSKPFNFTVVGDLPVQIADLAVHNGRIFVTTWPSLGLGRGGPTTAGVWMSRRLADGKPGLTTADAKTWKEVWNVTQYEPDPAVAATYGLGGIASYGGHLYWGTMHVPLTALRAHTINHQPEGVEQAFAAVNTQRAVSIFRASSFDKGKASAELLYGASRLPAFDPKANDGAGGWQFTPTGYRPRFGPAGFGNSYNNYTWKMMVAGDSLYVGTMDWSYLGKDLPPELGDAVRIALGDIDPASYGADLWVFDSPSGPARPVDTTGVGNYLNYGIRSMTADRSAIYLGMANPMNLRTDKSDDVPEGGWELIRLPVANSRPSAVKR